MFLLLSTFEDAEIILSWAYKHDLFAGNVWIVTEEVIKQMLIDSSEGTMLQFPWRFGLLSFIPTPGKGPIFGHVMNVSTL